MFGLSTFGVAMALLKWLPLRLVDKFLLLVANFTLGNTDHLGLRRPKTGPIELKNATGKTPVLDVGALSQIKSGKIKVINHPSPSTQTDPCIGSHFLCALVQPFAISQPILSPFCVNPRLFCNAFCQCLKGVFFSLSQVMEGVREITRNGAKFLDGQEKEFHSIILATGYKSNVPSWLKVSMTHFYI